MSPELFDLMLKFVLYAVDSPKLASSASTSPISCSHFVSFAEQCMEQVVALYEKTANMDVVIKNGVLEKAVTVCNVQNFQVYIISMSHVII